MCQGSATDQTGQQGTHGYGSYEAQQHVCSCFKRNSLKEEGHPLGTPCVKLILPSCTDRTGNEGCERISKDCPLTTAFRCGLGRWGTEKMKLHSGMWRT